MPAKIEVQLDFSEEHCYVEADADQIAQVLRNLIDNAIKFTPGGGKLRLSTEPELQAGLGPGIGQRQGSGPGGYPLSVRSVL